MEEIWQFCAWVKYYYVIIVKVNKQLVRAIGEVLSKLALSSAFFLIVYMAWFTHEVIFMLMLVYYFLEICSGFALKK